MPQRRKKKSEWRKDMAVTSRLRSAREGPIPEPEASSFRKSEVRAWWAHLKQNTLLTNIAPGS